MNSENYKLKPWKQYRLADNGTFAPKGSSPLFHTENSNMEYGVNPLHPNVKGFIMHNDMRYDELVPPRVIPVYSVIAFIEEEPEVIKTKESVVDCKEVESEPMKDFLDDYPLEESI